MKIRMGKSKSASRKPASRKPTAPKPVAFGKKSGTRRVTVANLERLVATAPAPAPAPAPRPFVVPTILMGTNVELPSALHNNVNFVEYYKELEDPPKLGNGSLVFRPKIVKGPLLTNALAARAGVPAGGGGGGSIMPWSQSAPSVGPHSGTFKGFGTGTGSYGALSPNLTELGVDVNSLFSPKGGRRKSQRRSRKSRKSRRSTKQKHK